MLNYIWPIFLIISFIYGLCFGNVSELNNSIFTSTESAVTLTIKLLGTMCLWNGIMKIVYKTSLLNKINKLIYPLIKHIFPNIKKSEKVYSCISMNIIANMLGLGNAATPLGLKAMEELQNKNNEKSKLSDEMFLFIVLNTASIQIIPTTVIAIRHSLGSSNPASILFGVWIATICAAISAIFSAKILLKRW